MLIEAAQAVAEVAKTGSVTIAIPTAVLTSIATLMLYKGVPFLVNTMRGKPKNGSGGGKPGEGKTCEIHGLAIDEVKGDIIRLETEQKNTDKLLGEVRDDVKEILRRVPK